MVDSPAEVEYVATSEISKEVLRLRKLLHILDITQNNPIELHVDNKLTIFMAKNHVSHYRMKHIQTKVHRIHELVQDCTLQLQHCPTKDQVANIFTKPLSR